MFCYVLNIDSDIFFAPVKISVLYFIILSTRFTLRVPDGVIEATSNITYLPILYLKSGQWVRIVHQVQCR